MTLRCTAGELRRENKQAASKGGLDSKRTFPVKGGGRRYGRIGRCSAEG